MNSIFHEEITEHLAFRKKILAPSSFEVNQRALLSFDQHLSLRERTGNYIDEDDVVSWVQPMYHDLAPSTIAPQVCYLRVFLQYLKHKGISVYIPKPTKVPDNYIPYLFSDTEIEKIFAAADSFPMLNNSNRHLELPMLLRMLYCCGFRLDELLKTQVGDVDFERGVILLRNTKNKKQRIVPLGDNLTAMLYRYCLALNRLTSPLNYIFPGKGTKNHLSKCTAEAWFRELLRNAGIYIQPKEHTRGQCLHCFRHLFAIKSFAQMEQAGRTVKDSIPFLSVYLGHAGMTQTEKYLKFSSDMFPQDTALFEAYSEGIFPEVRYED